MLALVRRRGQAIRIGEDIRLTVLKISGERVMVQFQGQTRAFYVGESFRVGVNVVVSVVRIEHRRVLFGIEADRSIPVDREEVYLRKLHERMKGGA